MDEFLSNADPAAQQIYGLISLALMLGGAVAGLFVLRLHRRNPPPYRDLAEQLADRAWNTVQVAVLLGSYFLLYLVAAFGVQFVGEQQIPVAELLITLLIYAVMAAAISIIVRRRGGSWQTGFGMGLGQMKSLLLSPIFYLAIIPFLMLATMGYHYCLRHFFDINVELQEVAQEVMGDWTWLKIFYTVLAIVIAPLFEELVFRGILFPYFVKRLGMAAGTSMVSLFFALLHLHIPSLVPLYLLSAALCLAYWRTGSLWTSIGMHVIFNTVTILLLKVIG